MNDCNHNQFNPLCEICFRRVRNDVRRSPPKNWYVISSLEPDGSRRTVAPLTGLPPGWTLAPDGFVIDIPSGMMLWSLGVDYPTTDGAVLIGLNNPPIPVRAGVFFNLSTVEFPCDLIGPLQILIIDPAVDVNFYGIVAEI